jgi:transposase InsO family protein
VTARYEFIDAEKATMDDNGRQRFPVRKMCEWLGVSASGFYDWLGREESWTAWRRAKLAVLVRASFEGSDGTYGYRRVHAELVRWGHPCHPEVVRSLMGELGLVACQPRPYRPVTTVADPAAEDVPDLVGRDFTADVPGQKMVGDITYIRTWSGWVYLATVIDCYSKAVLGYAMAEHMRTDLVIAAMAMAVRNHNIPAGAIFHSDRGSQYTSAEFRKYLRACEIRASVGRTGICYDNAMAESFNAAVKVELVHRTVYPTPEKAIADIARYVELRYNRRRLHSGLGYKTPHEVYNEYLNQQQAA